MKPFTGFAAGKTRFTPLPDLFFSELLGSIDDLAELKLTLYFFWSLNRQSGYPRYLTATEMAAEGPLLSALKTTQEDSSEGHDLADLQNTLNNAVSRAVARGTLLELHIEDEAGTETYYFANTAQGRQAVKKVKEGTLILERTGYVHEPHLEQERPTIYELYEQNIGLLLPLIVEELKSAERDYPDDWIADAFQIAVERNARNWRYIKAILERWSTQGRDDER